MWRAKTAGCFAAKLGQLLQPRANLLLATSAKKLDFGPKLDSLR